jgi:hypothetical protein
MERFFYSFREFIGMFTDMDNKVREVKSFQSYETDFS